MSPKGTKSMKSMEPRPFSDQGERNAYTLLGFRLAPRRVQQEQNLGTVGMISRIGSLGGRVHERDSTRSNLLAFGSF